MILQAIRYERGKLEILDQLRLPHDEVYITIKSPQYGWDAIKTMQVRGVPAIAIVAALSLAVWLALPDTDDYPLGSLKANAPAADVVSHCLKYFVTSRPTAVNLLGSEKILVDDVQANESIGRNGAQWIE